MITKKGSKMKAKNVVVLAALLISGSAMAQSLSIGGAYVGSRGAIAVNYNAPVVSTVHYSSSSTYIGAPGQTVQYVQSAPVYVQAAYRQPQVVPYPAPTYNPNHHPAVFQAHVDAVAAGVAPYYSYQGN